MKKIIFTIAIGCPLFSIGQLQLAKIFSDNMILQRNEPIHIWGKGTPGKPVSILFSNEVKGAIVNTDSSWNIYFKKQKANSVAQSIQIKSGKESIELKNILIGDI